MMTRLSLLVATTTLATGLALPAVSAPQIAGPATGIHALIIADADQPLPVIRVSGDDDDDDDDDGDEGRGWKFGHDDDDDDDDDGDDDDDDDCEHGRCPGAGRNPAPAGTVAPPANGLFGNGAPPKAVTK